MREILILRTMRLKKLFYNYMVVEEWNGICLNGQVAKKRNFLYLIILLPSPLIHRRCSDFWCGKFFILFVTTNRYSFLQLIGVYFSNLTRNNKRQCDLVENLSSPIINMTVTFLRQLSKPIFTRIVRLNWIVVQSLSFRNQYIDSFTQVTEIK